jgi:hypothetical protein
MSPGCALSAKVRAKRIGTGNGMRAAVAAGFDPFNQRIGIDPFDRGLTGRIDRRGIDHVGIVEGGLEIFHVIAQPGEAVRLDHGDDPPGTRLRAQRPARRGFRPGGGRNRRSPSHRRLRRPW